MCCGSVMAVPVVGVFATFVSRTSTNAIRQHYSSSHGNLETHNPIRPCVPALLDSCVPKTVVVPEQKQLNKKTARIVRAVFLFSCFVRGMVGCAKAQDQTSSGLPNTFSSSSSVRASSAQTPE